MFILFIVSSFAYSAYLLCGRGGRRHRRVIVLLYMWEALQSFINPHCSALRLNFNPNLKLILNLYKKTNNKHVCTLDERPHFVELSWTDLLNNNDKKKKKSFKVISSFVPGHNLITESVFYDVTPSLCYLSSRLPPSQWPGRRSLCPGGVCPHTTLNNVTPLRAYHAYPNRDLSLIAADLGHRSVSDWSHPSPLPLFPIRGLNRNTEEKRNTFVCRRYSGTFSSWLSF